MENRNTILFNPWAVTATTAIDPRLWINSSYPNEAWFYLMIRMPDGIVSIHLDGERYRGAYYINGDELLVTAYGLAESSADMAVLQGERGKAANNLAKLVLIDMVRSAKDPIGLQAALSMQGSTTHLCLHGSTTQIGF